ncbi:hypothetical protein [Caloranaerobacter ferrireducens]|uniref:hypothetical protein n=1 Tax=Caloranaerobacter ferrireducens TaxID=1323370 RepID=UPI00084D961E|nr:hypothetical protein [Caloranaerobacter ferrireducens]
MKVILLILLLIPFVMLQTYIIKDVSEVARRGIKHSSYSRNNSMSTYNYYRHSRFNKNNIRAVK